jgi:hypothetical protein
MSQTRFIGNAAAEKRCDRAGDAPWWPVAVLLIAAALSVAGAASPFGESGEWALCLVSLWLMTAGIAIVGGALVLRALSRKRWRRAATLAILPVAVVIIGLWSHQIALASNDLGTRIYFLYMRRTYMRQVENSGLPNGDRFAVFIRGGMPGSHQAIFYDETDEIARPEEAVHPIEWESRVRAHGLNCPYEAKSLSGHFYIGYLFC